MSSTDNPSAETPQPDPAVVESSRVDRLAQSKRDRRPRVVAALVIAGILAALLAWGGWTGYRWATTRPPQRVVVIGESQLEDGTTVAGLVASATRSEDGLAVTGLDTGARKPIPGTSYDRLRDALPMGGPDAVVAASVSGDERTAWILLDQEAWAQAIDAAGGVKISIPASTTVFTGEKLYRFEAGERTLTGAEAAALVMGADEIEASAGAAGEIRKTVAVAVADALSDPATARTLLGERGVELSTTKARIEAFFSQQ